MTQQIAEGIFTFSIPGKEDMTQEEILCLENIPQVRRSDGISIQFDVGVTGEGVKKTILKMKYHFQYSDLNSFMNNLKKLLGKMTHLGAPTKKETVPPAATASLQFELPETFLWNEHEKRSLQPGVKDMQFYIATCTFGRRMTWERTIGKYLDVSLSLPNLEKNLVLAVVHTVNAFQITGGASGAETSRNFQDVACQTPGAANFFYSMKSIQSGSSLSVMSIHSQQGLDLVMQEWDAEDMDESALVVTDRRISVPAMYWLHQSGLTHSSSM